MSKKPTTHVALILDRSSSMSSIREEAIGAFNDQLRVIREESEDGTPNLVTLTTFATTVDDFQFFDEAPKQIPTLTLDRYQPGGSTALLDAIMKTVDAFRKLPDADDPDTSFLVAVITDGEENSSQEYSLRNDGPKRVGETIKELEATQRWTFTYLCANVDPTKIQRTLNISAGNTMSFTADRSGTVAASTFHSASTSNYLKARKMGLTSTPTFYSGTKPKPPSQDLTQRKPKSKKPKK